MTPGRTISTMALLLAFLGSGLIAQAYRHHDCRQIELSYQKRATIPAQSSCEHYISLQQMRAQMTTKLIRATGSPDVCQGDDGFGPLSGICMYQACQGIGDCRKECVCSMTFKAWRVHKEDQVGVSCAIGDYATRITGQPYVPPDSNDIPAYGYVLATASNDNVHCGRRRGS